MGEIARSSTWLADCLIRDVRLAHWTLGIPLIAALSACGSNAASSRQLAESHAAVRTAEELGAERHPRAALHLKLARDQLALAERLIRDGRGHRANAVLERAEADAELAITLSREARTREQAREALDRVRALEQRAQADSDQTGE